MTNKMTLKDYFNEVIELAKANDRPDLVAFAEGRIAVLDKKAGNKKPTNKDTGRKRRYQRRDNVCTHRGRRNSIRPSEQVRRTRNTLKSESISTPSSVGRRRSGR